MVSRESLRYDIIGKNSWKFLNYLKLLSFAIKSHHISKAYHLSGYCDDPSKFSSELKYILENPPELDKLLALERERIYDPTGMTSQPRKVEADLTQSRQKRFECVYCK